MRMVLHGLPISKRKTQLITKTIAIISNVSCRCHIEKQPHTFTMWKIGAPDSAVIDAPIICLFVYFVFCFVMVFMCSLEWRYGDITITKKGMSTRELPGNYNSVDSFI